MTKFKSICHTDYIYGSIKLCKGSEYDIVAYFDEHLFDRAEDKHPIYKIYEDKVIVITLGKTFKNHFYTENEMIKRK